MKIKFETDYLRTCLFVREERSLAFADEVKLPILATAEYFSCHVCS